jgi:hypothetical protein
MPYEYVYNLFIWYSYLCSSYKNFQGVVCFVFATHRFRYEIQCSELDQSMTYSSFSNVTLYCYIWIDSLLTSLLTSVTHLLSSLHRLFYQPVHIQMPSFKIVLFRTNPSID